MAPTSADRLSRLLALVPWLASHDGITIQQAADHFGISEQQLEKDLWLLVVCGLPGYGPDQLVDIDFWDDERIHVLDPQTIGRPLRMSAEESWALLLGLRALEQVPGTHDRSAVVSAISKLEIALDSEVRIASVSVNSKVHDHVLAAVEQALSTGADLSIEYASATHDEVTLRQIHPVQIHTTDGRSSLEAFCHLAGARRTFRLDRIRAAEVVPADGQVQADVPQRAVTHKARLRIADSAAWVADVCGAVLLEPVEHAHAEYELEYADPAWVISLVLARGGQIQVLEPKELRQEVAEAAQAALRAYAEA